MFVLCDCVKTFRHSNSTQRNNGGVEACGRANKVSLVPRPKEGIGAICCQGFSRTPRIKHGRLPCLHEAIIVSGRDFDDSKSLEISGTALPETRGGIQPRSSSKKFGGIVGLEDDGMSQSPRKISFLVENRGKDKSHISTHCLMIGNKQNWTVLFRDFG